MLALEQAVIDEVQAKEQQEPKAGTLRLGLYQYGGTKSKKDNLATAHQVISKAASLHLQSACPSAPLVVCFPELFLTGYNVGDLLHREAEPLDGSSILAVAEMAKANGVHVVFGYPEKVDDITTGTTQYFNSAVFIDCEGKILLNYRKTHLWGDYEKKYFSYGTSLAPLVKINGCPAITSVPKTGIIANSMSDVLLNDHHSVYFCIQVCLLVCSFAGMLSFQSPHEC